MGAEPVLISHGGSFPHDVLNAGVKRRLRFKSSKRYGNLGFRLVRSLDPLQQLAETTMGRNSLVLTGGAWSNDVRGLRVVDCCWYDQRNRCDNLGLRIARVVGSLQQVAEVNCGP